MAPKDFDGLIRLVNNSFLSEGDTFTAPTVVMFPFIAEGDNFDDGYGLAAAIISKSDKSRFDAALNALNAATKLEDARKALRKMPKHLFVTSLFRQTFATGSDGIVGEFTHQGEFTTNIVGLVTDDEISVDDLQEAVTTAADGRAIIAHRQTFLVSAKGRKYPFYNFDLK